MHCINLGQARGFAFQSYTAPSRWVQDKAVFLKAHPNGAFLPMDTAGADSRGLLGVAKKSRVPFSSILTK